MITVTIYPADPDRLLPAMFRREFTETVDADRCEAFFRRIGFCRIVRREA